MPDKIIFDTDILIDFLRTKEEAKILLQEAQGKGDIYISVVTVAEIISGMRHEEEEATEALLASLNILPVTEKIARLAGSLRRSVSVKKILLPDCLIAATAISENCVLATFNRKDYPFKELALYSN